MLTVLTFISLVLIVVLIRTPLPLGLVKVTVR